MAGVLFGRKLVHDDQTRSNKEHDHEHHGQRFQRFDVVEPRFGLLQLLRVKCLGQRLVAEFALFFFQGAELDALPLLEARRVYFPRAAAELPRAFHYPIALEARQRTLLQTNPTGRFRLAVRWFSLVCPHVDTPVGWCDFQTAFSSTVSAVLVAPEFVETTSDGTIEASGGHSPRCGHDVQCTVRVLAGNASCVDGGSLSCIAKTYALISSVQSQWKSRTLFS